MSSDLGIAKIQRHIGNSNEFNITMVTYMPKIHK